MKAKPKIVIFNAKEYTAEQLQSIWVFSQRDWDRFIELLEWLATFK